MHMEHEVGATSLSDVAGDFDGFARQLVAATELRLAGTRTDQS
jgi:hypothetical protein